MNADWVGVAAAVVGTGVATAIGLRAQATAERALKLSVSQDWRLRHVFVTSQEDWLKPQKYRLMLVGERDARDVRVSSDFIVRASPLEYPVVRAGGEVIVEISWNGELFWQKTAELRIAEPTIVWPQALIEWVDPDGHERSATADIPGPEFEWTVEFDDEDEDEATN